MRIEASDAPALLAEIGDGEFTVAGRGVYWPFSEFRYRATGLTPDGKGVACEIVTNVEGFPVARE